MGRPAWFDMADIATFMQVTHVTKAVMTDERIIVIGASDALMPAAFALRHRVFVGEQQVPPELERDEFDDLAIHLVALRGDDVIGTLRVVVAGRTAKIGRMAVLAQERRSGIGSRLMERAADIVQTMGVTEIELHAQLTAKAFYTRLGYREEGRVFEEAGIAHVTMRKTLT
jgi:predicted GNAT family N-acyltransferase